MNWIIQDKKSIIGFGFFFQISKIKNKKQNCMSLTSAGNLHSIPKKELTTQWWSIRMTQVSASFSCKEICCPCNCDLTLIYCVSACPDSEPAVGPRLCILKREEGETYGFHLRVEKGHQGHIIRKVVSGGVGEGCGLRDGDRLLEINNCYVDDLPHPEVKAHDSVTLIQDLGKNKHKAVIFIFFRWPGK